VIDTSESDYVCGRLASETWELTAEEWRARRQLLFGSTPANYRSARPES
jgi:hypothetical protein